MIYNHGDAIIARSELFDQFIATLKHRYVTQCKEEDIHEMMEESEEYFGIIIKPKEDEDVFTTLDVQAEELMKRAGHMLDFNDIEVAYIYDRYKVKVNDCSEDEIESMIEDMYNLPREAIEEEMKNYYSKSKFKNLKNFYNFQ